MRFDSFYSKREAFLARFPVSSLYFNMDPDEDAGTESVVDCVAFFYEEGKGGENYRHKNKFRCRVNRKEKSLSKLREAVW